MTIRDLTHAVNGQLVLGDPRSAVNGASIDSRSVAAGSCFFALKGERTDGHLHAAAALRRGAGAVVVSQIDWLRTGFTSPGAVIRVADTFEALRRLGQAFRNRFKGAVVGITGSNGKTTTKQMTASVLGALGPGLATSGNYNSQIGLPLVLSGLQSDHRWMALEMGASAPGNIAALAEIGRPTIGILTSIGPAHLATFGSLERIAESKWELMDALPSDGCAIVPRGEPLLEPHIRTFKKRIVFFGEDPSCPVRASAVRAGETVSFLLHIGSESAEVLLPLSGRCNVGNALAAAAAGWVLGISLDEIARRLAAFEPPPMRMQVVRHPDGCVIVNDAYNANPASMLHSVRSLVETFPDRRKVVVVGSMLELGHESDKYHFHLGADLARFPLDRVLLVGEETRAVEEGALSVEASSGRFERVASAEEAGERLRAEAKPGTVILLKGSRGVHLEIALDRLMGTAGSAEKAG